VVLFTKQSLLGGFMEPYIIIAAVSLAAIAVTIVIVGAAAIAALYIVAGSARRFVSITTNVADDAQHAISDGRDLLKEGKGAFAKIAADPAACLVESFVQLSLQLFRKRRG
jgi:hypothetical protein